MGPFSEPLQQPERCRRRTGHARCNTRRASGLVLGITFIVVVIGIFSTLNMLIDRAAAISVRVIVLSIVVIVFKKVLTNIRLIMITDSVLVKILLSLLSLLLLTLLVEYHYFTFVVVILPLLLIMLLWIFKATLILALFVTLFFVFVFSLPYGLGLGSFEFRAEGPGFAVEG